MANKKQLDFSGFEWITFDCYGTLIDWEIGILSALRPVLNAHGISVGTGELLELYGQLEAEIESESQPYISYRDVLKELTRKLGERLGFLATENERESLPESLPSWRPFEDTVAALRLLKTKYKLGIVSNTDDEFFAASAKHLSIGFDMVVTAQQARSYKPARNNFLIALKQSGAPKAKILHAGQSIYHDIIPSKALGIANVWVNRRRGQNSAGATKLAVADPDLEVPDLRTLASMIR
jgi:2-haloacid dehalogenase